MLTLLIKDQGFFEKEQSEFDINNRQSYINLFIALVKYNFSSSFKNYIISIINLINPDILNTQDECKYDEFFIKDWFNKKGIDLENDVINIKGTLIPNFYKLNKVYNLIDLHFEFYHLLYKIYKPVIENNYCFYEAGKYKISSNDIIFDCGANMGMFAAYAASKGAKVYCFEPMSYIRNYLKEVQKLYPNNIIIIPYALGKFDCIEHFKQTLNPGACCVESSLMPITVNDSELYNERVYVTSIDNFIAEYKVFPTFIKMDIEGGESIALEGGLKFLKENKIILSISLDHNENDKAQLPNFIHSLNLNYQIYYFNKGDSINNTLFMLCK